MTVLHGEEDVRAGQVAQELAAAARDGRYETEGWRLIRLDSDGTIRSWSPGAQRLHQYTAAEVGQPPVATTVLYIDDNPAIRGLAERILTKDPAITVLTAADADTGLRQAAAHLPDLILLDLQLPGGHGETLIGKLRGAERTSSIPIIVVSGDTSPAAVKRLTGLGVTPYLAKPFDAEHLRAVVATAMSPGGPAPLS